MPVPMCEGEVITPEQAEAAVDRRVKVPLTATRRAALISFCYNIGEQASR